MKKELFFLSVIYTLTVICFLFILVPIFYLFISTDLTSFKTILQDSEVWKAIAITFKSAIFATLIGIIIGVPTSYFLSERKIIGKEFLESLINLPIVIPHVAVGIILLRILNQNSFLGNFFSLLGIQFVDTIYGIIVAMCFVSISYLITSSLLGFRSINRELIWTARSLGASPSQVLRFIILPLALPHILRGAVLSFARSISEIGALLIIAYHPPTAPILMYERFENYGLKASMPIAALIVLISLILFSILLIITHTVSKEKLKDA